MKKLHVLLAAFLIAAMFLPACAPATADCASEEVFCVGLVTDVGKINDKSFNQSAWEGVKQAEKDLGALVQYIETADVKDYAKNISTFADESYDVIVTVGFNLRECFLSRFSLSSVMLKPNESSDFARFSCIFGQKPVGFYDSKGFKKQSLREGTRTAAETYPNLKFIGVDQDQFEGTIDNLAGLVFPEDKAGFLVGALATMMSKTHKIGAVCSTDASPPIWRLGEGYRAGAAYADELNGTNTNVSVVYHSDVGFDKTFVDPEWGEATANSMMNQGADAIFGCGGITGDGAITAAAQAGAYAIGVDTDQYLTLPEAAPRMLSSAMKLITPSVFELVKLSKDGAFPSGNYFGDITYAPYHDLENEVPIEVKTAMEQIKAGLLDGSIETNVPPVKP